MIEIEVALTENTKGELGFVVMHLDGKIISGSSIHDAQVYAKVSLQGFGSKFECLTRFLHGNRFRVCDAIIMLDRHSKESGYLQNKGVDYSIRTRQTNLRYMPVDG